MKKPGEQFTCFFAATGQLCIWLVWGAAFGEDTPSTSCRQTVRQRPQPQYSPCCRQVSRVYLSRDAAERGDGLSQRAAVSKEMKVRSLLRCHVERGQPAQTGGANGKTRFTAGRFSNLPSLVCSAAVCAESHPACERSSSNLPRLVLKLETVLSLTFPGSR